MQRWRHSQLARAVATILLLWTTLDLTNASLCALDRDEIGTTVSHGLGTTVSDDSARRAPSPQSTHIDDCFCCSHCVDIPVFVPPVVTEPATRRELPFDARIPTSFGFPLYHPPLA